MVVPGQQQYRINIRSVYLNIIYNLSVTGPLLLKELSGFKNVFFIKKADKFFIYIKYNYIIKIIIKLLYKFLYNLFNTELITLKVYLNKTLIKG